MSKAVEVVWEDQQRINTFNRLNTKMHELEGQLKGKKKVLEDMEDASNELMLSDEETVRFAMGECLVHFDKDAAEQKLEALTDKVKGEVTALNGQLEEVKEEMKKLKAILYAKFGSSINLEEE